MRNYFEEMNIDYNELKRYEDIETYYDEVEDYTKLIKELQCDRVEALKQIVNKNREIERLNNIIKKGITEEMKDELDLILKTNQKLAYRINNAIEYIYLHSTQRKWFADISDRLHNQKIQFKGRIQDLLNILKGVGKE